MCKEASRVSTGSTRMWYCSIRMQRQSAGERCGEKNQTGRSHSSTAAGWCMTILTGKATARWRSRLEDLVIYETHVRSFTRHASSGVRYPGTFAGIREKIPYLKSLGINCIELMPIFEFDEFENSRKDSRSRSTG